MEEIKQKKLQIILSAITLIIAVIIDRLTNFPMWINLIIYAVPYAIAGFDVIKEAIEGIKEKEIFSEDLLMTIATMGAMLIGFLPNSKSEFTEAVFVMLFFQVGELFEMIAEGNSKKSINSLMEIRPDYANLVENDNGKTKKVDPKTVKVGEIIQINPGEKVPMDGVIIEGKTNLNTVAITGESVPRSAKENEEIISGCVNLTGSVKVRVTKIFEESTASKIINLVENASEHKSSSDKFITKFAKIYTPIVVIAALVLVIVPSIITKDFTTWISRALTFLVVSCPCALVISVPLSYFGGIGGAAKKGILIKGANYLEALSKTKAIVFDKTGTLTEGVFEVVAIHPNMYDEKKLLHLASHVENYSTHPIAMSLKRAYSKMDNLDDGCKIKDIEEIAGIGVKAQVNDDEIYVGNKKLMNKIGIDVEECKKVGTIVHIATKNKYLGHVVISDRIKDDSKKAIQELKKEKIKTAMLTGDSKKIAENVANELKLDKFYAELMPEEKVIKVEQIEKEMKNNEKVAFVGDGINDAPVIARADIGIAMGAFGSDAAIEAADIVLMEDKISKICEAIKISKKTQRIAYENIYFALAVKLLVLILAAIGLAPMYLAVFADVGVTVLAVLNATRTLKQKKTKIGKDHTKNSLKI